MLLLIAIAGGLILGSRKFSAGHFSVAKSSEYMGVTPDGRCTGAAYNKENDAIPS
jgi:hypothetical protein